MTARQIIVAVGAGLALALIAAALILLRPSRGPEAAVASPPAKSHGAVPTTPSPAPPSDMQPPAPITPPLTGAARLDAAIAALRKRAGESPGATETQLAARERDLGRPVPVPVRRLLAAVPPRAWGAFVDGIRLEQLGDCQFHRTPYGDVEVAPGVDQGGPFFVFAAGDGGDGIVIDAAGRVILADHEGPPSVLADSLAGWLERLLAFDGHEYAYMRGEIYGLPADRARAFLTDHQRLNPDDEWAARQLMRLDFPGGHPLGHHVWDHEARRLVPVAEAAAAPHVQLDNASQRDIDAVARAKGCVHLMIIESSAHDLSPLNRLATLTDLYIYDVPLVDARQLAAHPALDDVCFLRCRVQHVDALAGIKTLMRLRLNESHVDPAEFARFRKLRPDVKLE